MTFQSRQSAREESNAKKKELAERFLLRSRARQKDKPLKEPPEDNPKFDNRLRETNINEVDLSNKQELILDEIVRYGQAGIPIYREGEAFPCLVSTGLARLVDLYLDVASTKKRRIALVWPAVPKNLLITHPLATLEYWAQGDKLGIRCLTFPAKSNIYYPLNHIHMDRKEILGLARELVLLSGQPNPRVKREFRDKDAYLFSMTEGSLKPEQGEQFNPTMGELFPHFYTGQDFIKWNSCAEHLLEHIAARLKRRAHKKALQINKNIIGDPNTAPDALFAIDGRLKKDDQLLALKALVSEGRPDVVLINASRPIRRDTSNWLNYISRFCMLVEEVFSFDSPGILIVTDEPHAAYRLREQVQLLNSKRPKEKRWKSSQEYFITGICNGISDDGLLAPGHEPQIPEAREFVVEIVDREASSVISRLYRAANRIPGGREAAKPVLNAATYLSRLAAMPCGVSTLIEWLSTSRASDYSRTNLSWSTFHSDLATFERIEECGSEGETIRECLRLGEVLYTNYQQATPFALRLAYLVGHSASEKKRRTILVFTSALYLRLAQRFLMQFSAYPDGAKFESFDDRVLFILSSELEDRLLMIGDAQIIFAGVDDDGLRLLMTNNQIAQHTVILLTQRAGQYLRAMLHPLAEKFTEFHELKPRMESILRQLKDLPNESNILSHADFVLPTFQPELIHDSGDSSYAADPNAYRIVLENSQVIYRRGSHRVYIYDPSSEFATERGFIERKVSSLKEGDRLFVMSSDLREHVEAVLKEAGVPIENDKTFEVQLREYHQNIKERLQALFPAKNLSDQVRQLRSTILEAHSNLAKRFPGEASVRHWVNLEASEDTPFEDLRPQAPMKKEHFEIFARTLGFSDLQIAYDWQRVIMAIRTSRRHDGRRVSDIYTHMLLEPESAMLHSNINLPTIKLLFGKARENIAIIESIIPPKEKTDD